MIYLELFWSFFQIGLFSFGGGYAAILLISEQVVNQKAWISTEAFSDLVTISQMTPGPIAINAASFVGIQVAGIPGAIVASLGNVFPCVIIVLLLSKLYIKYKELALAKTILKGLRPAIIALIASAALSLTREALLVNPSIAHSRSNIGSFNFFSIILFVISLYLYKRFRKIDPIAIMLIMGVIGGIGFYFFNL